MARRNPNSSSNTSCAICDSSNLASFCPTCVNYRLSEYYARLKVLKSNRDLRYLRLSEKLESRKKMDEQLNWRINKSEKIKKLKDRLSNLELKLSQEKSKVHDISNDLKLKYQTLDEARATLEKNKVELLEKFYPNLIYTQGLGLMAITSERLHKQSAVIKQICKLFPMRRVNSDEEKKEGYNGPYDQICFARLPKGLDPHSVPSEELAASLGYIVQLLNLVIPVLGAPALHNSGFAGSCSRVWQRDSYWDSRPSSQSKEYQLFIPRKNFCPSETSSTFGVSSVSSESHHTNSHTNSHTKPSLLLQADRASSFSFSSASLHSIEKHQDLQKGISLLKKSVACVTFYCYNGLGIEVPCESSTFEALGRLLGILGSSREIRAVLSRRMAWSRSDKQAHHLNRTVWNLNSGISSVLIDSNYSTITSISNNSSERREEGEKRERNNIVEEWDLVEHPKFPPPPSQIEDVEHWTRAMFIDANVSKK